MLGQVLHFSVVLSFPWIIQVPHVWCLLVLWWVDIYGNCLFPPGSSLSALFIERRRVNIVVTGGAHLEGTNRLFTQNSLRRSHNLRVVETQRE